VFILAELLFFAKYSQTFCVQHFKKVWLVMVISAIEKEKKAMCTKFQKQHAVCDVVFV